jgi:RecA/RadA recombinase
MKGVIILNIKGKSMSNDLLTRIKKNSTLKDYKLKSLADSTLLNDTDNIVTDMPILNLAFSGDLNKGFRSGMIQFAGPSKHFKTNLSLICVKAFLKKYPEGICLFFDSEFGITKEYLEAQNIDSNRMIHIPITNIEELRFELVNQLEGLTKEDKVIILIDSIGNLASKKELEDSKNENSAQDMSRPKMLKALGRIVTPHLTLKDIPLIAINHVYQEMGLFPKAVVGGGQGLYLSSNTIFIIGRSQEKDGSDLAGYTFTLNVEKSREVREKAKFKFTVLYDKGIDLYSGLTEIALAAGFLQKPSNGWYSRVINGVVEDKKYRAKEMNSAEFWEPILKDPKFNEACNKMFKFSGSQSDDIEEDDIDLSQNIDMSDVPSFDD